MARKFRVGRSESQTLKNLIRSYNREVIKMEANLPSAVHLPPSVDYDDIKSRIHSKRDFVRETNRLRRIKSKKAATVRELPSGTLITQYEYNEMNIMRRAFNQSRISMLKSLGINVERKISADKKYYYYAGKTTADRQALEGMVNALPVTRQFDWIPGGNDPAKRTRPIEFLERINRNRMTARVTVNLYYNSYMKALRNVFTPDIVIDGERKPTGNEEFVEWVQRTIDDLREAGIPLEDIYRDTAATELDASLFFIYDPTAEDIRIKHIRKHWEEVRKKYLSE